MNLTRTILLTIGASALVVSAVTLMARNEQSKSTSTTETESKNMLPKVQKTDAEWQKELTPEEYRITRQKGTEPAFTGKYYNHHDDGMYMCNCCGAPLFDSKTKYESGCGWPSFFQPATDGTIDENRDTTHGMIRTEIVCSSCNAHLGHVFEDGPNPTGLRYCVNSASLQFKKRSDSSEKK